MKDFFKRALLMAGLAMVMTIFAGAKGASAQTLTYPYNYLTIDVRDDVLVMTSDTKRTDAVWLEAGIVNPDEALEDFKNMGVMASFYDKETKTTVNFIAKKSTDTVQRFNFDGMSDDDVIKYITEGIGDTEDARVSVSLFDNKGIRFFKIHLLVSTELTSALEVLSGTLINGQMIQFGVYEEGTDAVPVVNEAFLDEIVSCVSFTDILTPEEYADLTKASMLKVGLIILAVIVGFILLVVFSKLSQKHNEKKAKNISAYMQDFRAKERAGGIDRTQPPVFTAHTVYSDDTIDDFCMYTTWLKDVSRVAAFVLLFGGMTVFMFANNSVGYGLIFIVLAAVILYFAYSRGEKQKKVLKDQYNTKAKPVAELRFYDEYFDVLGLGSRSEYIYKQVTMVRTYKTCMYLYLGNEHAMIVDLTSLPEGKDRELYVYVKKLMNRDR